MTLFDTICAPITAPGGAVAIIRLSGPESWEVATRAFNNFPAQPESHRAYYGTFANGDEYRGEFAQSQFHGKGVFTAKNGQQVVGLFSQGRFVGPVPDQGQMRCVECREMIDNDCLFCPTCRGKQ